MKNFVKSISLVGVMVATFNANAVQRDITVTANIDPTVDLTLADGTPLPTAINMQYLPGKGLAAYRENVKFWSNTADRALNVSLASTPQLTDENGSNPIPLSVSINGNTLSTTAISLAYASTFPNGISNGSSVLPLVISQKSVGVVSQAGIYKGIVSLVVSQGTAPQK